MSYRQPGAWPIYRGSTVVSSLGRFVAFVLRFVSVRSWSEVSKELTTEVIVTSFEDDGGDDEIKQRWPVMVWIMSGWRLYKLCEGSWVEELGQSGRMRCLANCMQEENYNSRADYWHGYHFCCFSGQGWTNVAQSSNVEIRRLTNLGNMFIERHTRV